MRTGQPSSPSSTGKEAALNWLVKVEGTNGIGPSDVDRTSNPDERDLRGASGRAAHVRRAQRFGAPGGH